MFKGTAVADTRYTFTPQFLEASAIFVRRARSIEAMTPPLIDDTTRCEHLGLITAVIMQSAAALETQAHEVCFYGPGAHLGSNGTDYEAQRVLFPKTKMIDRKPTMTRFNVILQLLGKASLDELAEPFQSTDLVVRLRNEIVHYKSRLGADMETNSLFTSIQALGHKPPPFADHSGINFFPRRCLSADCGAWALTSVAAFINSFYSALGVPSPLQDYSWRLVP